MKRLVLIVFLTVCCLAPVGQSAGQQPTLTYPFFGMEWSPDGTSVAFTSKEGAWLYSGGSYYEITLGPIDDVTWSPDGRFIALLRHDIGADSEVQFTGYIEIWDVSSPSMPSQGQIIKDGGMSGDVENLDWSPTGNLIAVSGRGIRIWSATTGVLVRTIATDQISSDVQWSPNEFSVASFSEVLNVWNGLTGELLHSIDFPLYVDSGSWGLHRQQVAVVQSNYDTKHELNLLDLSQPHPELLPLILTADNPVGYTEWKGNTVASGTTEGIQLWDVSTQQTITMISVSGLWNFALSPDGSQIAYIRKDGVLQIQTVNTPFVSTSTEQQPTLTYPFFGMEWSPDGTSVAFTSKEGAWLYSGGSYYEITLGPIDDVTWSPDGRFIALLRHNQYHETEIMFTGYIEIWDMTVPTMPVFVRTMEDNGMKGGDIENLDWSPTSNLIAVSGRGIRIWNTDTGELVRTLQRPSEKLRS